MDNRIERMVEAARKDQFYPDKTAVEYDSADLFLPEPIRNAKRASEYILAQTVSITDDDRMVGMLRFDGSTPGEIYHRLGFTNFNRYWKELVGEPQENLCCMEWQHSTADFDYVLKYGLTGIMDRIAASKKAHEGSREAMDFLEAEEIMCRGIIRWEEKCGEACREKAAAASGEEKARYLKMAERIARVPLHPAENFADAVQCIYFCFQFQPDSPGLLDRYLLPFYRTDIASGTITCEQAKLLIQELYVMMSASIPSTAVGWGNRSGDTHFSVGGYNAQGEDSFNELSVLLVEALTELPIYRPQISLRWTKKTPTEVLRFMLDQERKDAYKRITVTNDEPRIGSFVNNLGMAYEDAVRYTMVGCNEPAFPGGIFLGGCKGNIARSLEHTLYERQDDVLAAKNFDELYDLYEEELRKDIERMLWYDDAFNRMRAEDIDVVSSLFMEGPIENARSASQGGVKHKVTCCDLMGVTCVIDSLSIIKQFVFDEKLVTMKELLTALVDNWKGHDDLRSLILKKGRFFGNHDELSDQIGRRFTDSLYRITKDKRCLFDARVLFGTLTGYRLYYAWFGEKTPATPDGRFAGDPFMVGVGQSFGKDREGLSALLSSVALLDPNGIMTGATICNVMLDKSMVQDDRNFEKTVKLLETYLQMGGLHFQLSYVSEGELLDARKNPEQHRNLRVRVTGYSAYYVTLEEQTQRDVLERTRIRA